MNELWGRCSILTRRWSRASYNVTDAGIVSRLWVSLHPLPFNLHHALWFLLEEKETSTNRQNSKVSWHSIVDQSVRIDLPVFGRSAASGRSGWRRDFLSNRKYRYRPYTQPDVGNCWPWRNNSCICYVVTRSTSPPGKYWAPSPHSFIESHYLKLPFSVEHCRIIGEPRKWIRQRTWTLDTPLKYTHPLPFNLHHEGSPPPPPLVPNGRTPYGASLRPFPSPFLT